MTAIPDNLRPVLDPLIEMLSGSSSTAWLVGGIVRDALLDRPLTDVDVACSDDPSALARKVASAFGGSAFPLNDRHGAWRVDRSHEIDATGDGAYSQVAHIDVCQLRANSIEQDLRERDFTINAMAVPIVENSPGIIDVGGGVDDLQSRRIRVIGDQALIDDPLRLIRAVRIAHAIGFTIDDSTRASIQRHKHLANKPAGERIFAELSRILLAGEARSGLRLLESMGLLDEYVPELQPCKGLEQSKFHHLDVFEHTLAVVDNCEDILNATEFWLPSRAEHRPPSWSSEQRLIVLLAGLCHDLGKPGTHRILDDGRVAFVGHDETGVAIVDDMCERWKMSNRVTRGVQHLVRTHLALGFLLHGPRDARSRWRFLRQVAPVEPEAIVLSMADRMATSGVGDKRRWARAHIEMARELWHDYWQQHHEGIPEPLLDGTEIAAELGITPGPRIGELVSKLAEEQAIGCIRDRDDAIAFIRSANQ